SLSISDMVHARAEDNSRLQAKLENFPPKVFSRRCRAHESPQGRGAAPARWRCLSCRSSDLQNERPVTSISINVNQERDMKLSLLVPFAALVAFFGGHGNLSAQQQSDINILSACRPGERCTNLSLHAEQVAEILEIKPLVEQALAMRASRPAGAAMTGEELSLRQEITEATVAASFDVDGVLAEIEQEQAHI